MITVLIGEKEMEKPLVSVRLITYNQEKYIATAIESILNQKVDFCFELLIGEDASTDGTAAIVDSYQKKYPDIIKVFHREKNIGSKMNSKLIMQECRGKYVAVLEGDDYWNCEMKLQKQVDYLEEHEDVIATAHNIYSIDKDGKEIDIDEYIDFPMQKKHVYNKFHAMRIELIGHVSSYVYRNIKYLLDKEQWKAFFRCNVNGDLKLSITLGMLGKVVFFEDVWSCRRLLFEGEGWTAITYQKNLSYFFVCSYIGACRYIREAFGIDADISEKLLIKLKQANNLAIKSPSKENITVAVKINIVYAEYILKNKIRKCKYLKIMQKE